MHTPRMSRMLATSCGWTPRTLKLMTPWCWEASGWADELHEVQLPHALPRVGNQGGLAGGHGLVAHRLCEVCQGLARGVDAGGVLRAGLELLGHGRPGGVLLGHGVDHLAAREAWAAWRRAASCLPHSTPMPMGPSALWAEKARKSAPSARTSTAMCGHGLGAVDHHVAALRVHGRGDLLHRNGGCPARWRPRRRRTMRVLGPTLAAISLSVMTPSSLG